MCMCDTEMAPANFRGVEPRRKDILLELSVDLLLGWARTLHISWQQQISALSQAASRLSSL